MTEPDGWKSPYDPPQQPSTPGPTPPVDPTPAPGQAGPPAPYQPGPYQPDPYQPSPYQVNPYQQPSPYEPGPYQPGPYQPGPYQPQYGAPYGYPAPFEKNSLGVWSLSLGIGSLVLLFLCGGGIFAAVPALITGHMSRRAEREGQADNGGMGLVGIITGWVTIGLTLLGIVLLVVLFGIGFYSAASAG